MKPIFLILITVCSAFAASPVTCTANAGTWNWSNASAWSGCSGASGGTSITYRGATASTLASGVPGASASLDRVDIPSGATVTVDVPISLGDATSGATVTALTIESGGTLIVSKVIRVAGYSTIVDVSHGGLLNLKQGGTLTVQPGGSIWVDTAQNLTGEMRTDGNLYIGCGKYAVSGCAANAGFWGTVRAGTPGTIAAYTGGSGLYSAFNSMTIPSLSVGDLIELGAAPLPAASGTGALGPPYTKTPCVTTTDPQMQITVDSYCGIPPSAPAPPVAPLTTDSTMCGGASSCAVPLGYPLCVVNVSPLEVGFAAYASDGWHCSGSTAIAITDAGTGPFWISKPAFLSPVFSNFSWSTSVTPTQPSSFQSWYDATRTHYLLAGAPASGISNAAGTGPAKDGDTSFTASAVTIISQAGGGSTATSMTLKPRCSGLTTIGDYSLDWEDGYMCLWGGSDQITATLGWKALTFSSRLPQFDNQSTGAGTELLIENADIRGLYSSSGGNPVWSLSGYNNSTSNNRLRMEGSTFMWDAQTFSLSGATGTSASPVAIEGNTIYTVNTPLASPLFFQSGSASAATYVSMSANFLAIQGGAPSGLASGVTPSTNRDNNHWYFVGNVGRPSIFMDSSAYGPLQTWGDALVSRNRFDSPGYNIAGGDGMIKLAGTAGHPALIEWNEFYGYRSTVQFDHDSTYRYNFFPFSGKHHSIVANEYTSTTPAYIPNVTFEHMIQAGWQIPGGSPFVNLGYQAYTWIDNAAVYNNTSIGAQQGCVSLQKSGDSEISVVTRAYVANQVCQDANGSATFFDRGATASAASLNNVQLVAGLNNSMYGTFGAYYTVNPSPPANQNTTTLNGFAAFTWHSGTNYNTDATRALTGVVLQNPTYTSATGTLSYSYTSASNRTLSWNDGSGAGTAVQLNWGGAGTSYTVSGAPTIPYLGGNNGTIAVSGTPFTCSGGAADANGKTYYVSGCPAGNFVVMTSGTANGQVFSIQGATSSTVIVTPVPTGVANADTFVILVLNGKLNNSGATNSVEFGLYPASLPNSSVSDSGISVAVTNICASGCAATGATSVPDTWTWDSSNNPLGGNLPYPMEGPDPTVSAFSPSGPYASPNTAWKTQSTSGSYIGAVLPLATTSLTSSLSSVQVWRSATLTYTLSGGVGFTGGTIETCSDGGSGIFSYGASGGVGSLAMTPAMNATTLTFSYTPVATGSVTISCTTALGGGWSDPAGVALSATANTSFFPFIMGKVAGNVIVE